LDFHEDSGELRRMSEWMRKLSVENMRSPVRRGSLRGGWSGSTRKGVGGRSVKKSNTNQGPETPSSDSSGPSLYLQGGQSIPLGSLVSSAGLQYNLTSSEYLDCMESDSTWGGGPEIVSLSNALRVPIHVYELCWVGKGHPKLRGGERGAGKWGVRRMACFGSPKWDRRGCLEILSCDSRFPDLGRGKAKEGNHFMYLERVKGREE
jgi:hypothetical protein